MTKDNVNNTTTAIAVAPIKVLADGAVVGLIVDTLGFESGKISIATGIVTTGDIAFVSIEESADSGMSGATVIPDTRLINKSVVPLTASASILEIGFIADFRFVRLNLIGANTSVLLLSAAYELGHPAGAPV